jgi:DNA-directed RNA polymerase specialized sigma subunit
MLSTNMDERLVLTYRYLKNYTWTRIGDELYADERTIRRWHDRALSHVVVPENPTVI